MKTKTILFLSILMIIFACKNSKSSQKSSSAVQEKYRVIVSFISKGSGTDKQTIAGLEAYLLSFGKKYKKTILYDKVQWGREGEVDYCFKLKELSGSKQNEFVKGLQNVTKASQLVFIKEKEICTHKK